ncbi:hypothetical protein SAMN04244579_00256 [Azotobacter beijerinckii]|uniref:N-formylglutamate amidohydrolase n=1 Tax=Azotobacter beijerinckii TaxID=170623 RepID=A0A1H6QLD7_9GAMM|nr:hypothetical protein [Azotobacter beijerinckii]SEI40270.1 hypothetical protein SAMN04244579_00256 [Azotobacter beijerinckii]
MARDVDPAQVAVLEIPEGLSGQPPPAARRFQYETLHRALYLQLLPHVLNHHRLLVDLHSGADPQLGADLICADPALCACLRTAVAGAEQLAGVEVRVVPLGDEGADLHARTIIPPQVWRNPAFLYLGLEIYLPEPAKAWQAARELARELIGIAARCVGAGGR